MTNVDKSLHLGDCVEVMRRFSGGTFDVVIADPPYKMTKRGKSCRPNYMPDNMGDNVFEGELPDTNEWMGEVYRLMKDDYSHFYCFTNTISLKEYLVEAENVGFEMHNIIYMIKDTMMPNKYYGKNSEIVLFFRKGAAIAINDMSSKDWMKVTMPKKLDKNKVHISQKPISIIEKFLTNSTGTNRTMVLDPFMGSGTTGVACKSLGLDFVGIEKNEEYFNIANERISSGCVLETLF